MTTRREPQHRQQRKTSIAWSSLIFSLCGALAFAVRYEGEASLGFFLSFVVLLVFHDAYFYWFHRLLHLPKFYRAIHIVHHREVSLTTSSAWVMHPLEGVIEAAFFPLMALVNLDGFAFVCFAAVVFVVNSVGHSGHEIYPKRFFKSRLGLWLTTPTHHKCHHLEVSKNFGAYFCFWDRLMGTESKNYAGLRLEQSESPNRESLFSK